MNNSLKKILTNSPTLLMVVGLILLISPFILDNPYENLLSGAGALLLFLSWAFANITNRKNLISTERWAQQKKVMIAMSLCMLLGAVLLVYYEMQMPKYRIAITNKTLYKVPPQLNKKQLFELGSECNTYGNTLCSHAVFAKILKLDPRNFIALGNLAMAQSHLGFHEYAIQNFTTAIHHGAKTYDIFKFYGHSLKAVGNKTAAIDAYEKSLQLNPKQQQLISLIDELKN